MGQVY